MKKLIEMPYEGTTVIVAVEIPEELAKDEIHQVGAKEWLKKLFQTPEKVDQDFGLVEDMIIMYSRPIIKSFEKLANEKTPPKKASAEFSLSFNAKGNIYLVETSMNGAIKVSFEWDLA